MAITFGTRDLLEYDEKHRVLICRECKYAIQKSALGSHLLRHKIYRGERQRLLSSIAQLELLEPDDVQLPPAGSPPIDGLPIISGYRCTAIGCKNLCASSKRVRRHWSESHGMSDPPVSFACSVNLQTFFRGTKLRYFEITLSEAAAGTPLITSDGTPAQQHDLNVVATPMPRAQVPVFPLGPPCVLDLETLRYFHHFTTETSLTLLADKHWQMDVVAQALELCWLMYGLLAISASHLAALSDDETIKREHQVRSALFFQEFSTGWEEVKRNSGVAQVKEAEAGAQIICIQRCWYWTSEPPVLDQRVVPEIEPFELRSFTTVVQGCIDPDFALRSTITSDGMPEETFIRARNDMAGISDVEVPSNAPPVLLDHFRTLPYRMADALEKPDNAQDFFSTLSAISALVECCSLSYASDDAGTVWMGMESWLRRLSDHFNQMLWCRSPAALIVFAHWSLLLKRAERHYWFLTGLTTKVVRQIVRELPKDSIVLSLVENLID